MNKRFQVFVSSTYSDLIEERKSISQTLLQLDCIPTGMELFPAIDEEQFEFIKKIIDDSDYYLLIIGGRYGTLTSEGVSYTEKEYHYALEKGIKIIALLHENPDTLPLNKSENDEKARTKLEVFRETVSQGRLIKFWNTPSELPGLVAISFSQTIKTYPADGWVRASSFPTTSNLIELEELKKENEQLKIKLSHYQNTTPQISNIAGLNENFMLTGRKLLRGYDYSWSKELSWKDLFKIFSPYLMENPTQNFVKQLLEKQLTSSEKDVASISIDDQCFRTLSLQFRTLGLIKIDYLKAINGSMYLFWSLTTSGQNLMTELRIIRTNIESK